MRGVLPRWNIRPASPVPMRATGYGCRRAFSPDRRVASVGAVRGSGLKPLLQESAGSDAREREG